MPLNDQYHKCTRKHKTDPGSGRFTRRGFLRYTILLGLSGAASSHLAGLTWPRRVHSWLSNRPMTHTKFHEMGLKRCLDAHVHCGIQNRTTRVTIEDYLHQISGSPIKGAAMIPFASQIYDRGNTNFMDSPEWRQRRKRANEYLLDLTTEDFDVFPFFFIWNDFAVGDLTEKHRGIKWHRHSDEPAYRYDDPRCRHAIDEIRKRNMAVIFEEELTNTLRFIREIGQGVRVIIPHMGFLNGGYHAIVHHGLFALPNVYADTSLASTSEILDYLHRYGEERILFGSDFPFGDPITELKKVLRLPVPLETLEAIAGLNFQRLMSQSNR